MPEILVTSNLRTLLTRRSLYTIVLAVAVVLQLGLVMDDYISASLRRIWRFREMSAYDRGAMFAFGEEFLEYMQFVGAIVPEDAIVVIPKEAQTAVLGHAGIMQFFLFPRTIVDCPLDSIPDCLGLSNPSVYILAPDAHFPPRDISLEPKVFISLEGDRGILVPSP